MRLIHWFSLLLVLLSIGCFNNGNPKVTVKSLGPINESPVSEVKTHNFPFEDSIIINPENIWVEDSLLVMFTSDKQNFLRIYSLLSHKLIATYGFIGRGRDEFLYPQVFKNSPREYVITDRLRFCIINIDRLIGEDGYKPDFHNVDEGLNAIDYFATTENYDEIIFSSGSSDDQLCFMNLKDYSTQSFNCFPKIKGVDVSNFISHTNVFKASMTKMGDSLFFAYYYYPIIDIVSLDTRKVSRIQHPVDYGFNHVRVIDNINAVIDDPFLCNISSYSTKNYFYTLYYGDEVKNVENMDCLPQILKYNLDGDLISRFGLDCIATKFCVSDDDKNIYLLSYDDDFNPAILKVEI